MTAEKVSVHAAWSAVMGDVQSIGKNDRNEQQRFTFRGIDSVMSAVGPALRKHGVAVVPSVREMNTDTYTTKGGAVMRNATVLVAWTVYGPAGDSFEGSTYGEAADAGDKAVSKAHSVAYRTFLLQALCVPTNDPEPDAQVHEREIPDTAAADAARAELRAWCVDNGVSVGDVADKHVVLHGHPLRQEGDVAKIRAHMVVRS